MRKQNKVTTPQTQANLEDRVMLAGSYSHGFNNSLGEFFSNNPSNSYGIINGTFSPYFSEQEYREGGENSRYPRDDQGFEIRHSDAFFGGNIEISYDFLVPRTNSTRPFPDDKSTIVHQWYNWGGSARTNNWGAHLSIKNSDLYATYRASSNAGTEVFVNGRCPARINDGNRAILSTRFRRRRVED